MSSAWRAVLTVSLLIQFIGCDRKTDTSTAQSSSGPTSRSAYAASDSQVLMAVLKDLLVATGDQSPIAGQGEPPKEIAFSMKPKDKEGTLTQILSAGEQKRWDVDEPAQRLAAESAAANVLQRVRGHDGFAAFVPDDSRIKSDGPLSPGSQPATVPTDPLERLKAERYAPQVISAWPPGYSPDGKFAVVAISFPYFGTTGDAAYVLMQDNGSWKILSRKFLFYLG